MINEFRKDLLRKQEITKGKNEFALVKIIIRTPFRILLYICVLLATVFIHYK